MTSFLGRLLAAGLSLALAAGPAGAQQLTGAQAAAGAVTGAAAAAGAAPAAQLKLGPSTLENVRLSPSPLSAAPMADGVVSKAQAPSAGALADGRATALGLAQPAAPTLSAVKAGPPAASAGNAAARPAAARRVAGPVGPPAVEGRGAAREAGVLADRVRGSRARRQLGRVAKDWDKADSDQSPSAEGLGSASGGGRGVVQALRRAAARIVGWNFDWDDNIFYMPTKIVLFKKGTREERPVSTEEYAKIRKAVGSSGEWAGYEVDDDPAAGSFRYFHDHGGRNYFLEHIKEALEGKKAAWQGPSWDTFVFAMSRPESAARTTIITARGHSGETMLEGLKLLQEKGYISHLPRVENLHGVDQPKYKAASASISEAKAKVMRDVLDEVSASPLGEDAPTVLSQDGTSRKPLHLWGFSDDDWGNFKTALDALSADVKAGKYANVKITVLFTGKNNPDHEPGAWVIKSDGTPRPVTTDEHGEPYILHLEKPGEFKKPKFTALPYPEVGRSALPSADRAFERMFVSNSVPASHEILSSGEDLLARERGAITAFIDDAKVPDRLKRIILTRYSINDEALARELVRAKKKGIRTTLVTDLNVSMDFEFKEGQAMITDFSKAKLKDDAAGNFIRILLDGGFKLGEDIVSQPLYNHGDSLRDPLMHEKTLILVVEEEGPPSAALSRAGDIRIAGQLYFGTANLATNPRYNRVFKVSEQALAERALAHAEAMIEAFKAGKPIKEIESEPPFRVYFEDESFVELAYTNGKYNPNERLVALLRRAASEPESFQISEVILSHFVLTNGEVVDSLKEAMKAQEAFTVTAVLDDKFIPVRGYGRAANLAGIPTVPEMGRISFGFGFNLRKRIKAWAYQRAAVGPDGKQVVEKSLEGPPLARHLWHDKTTLVYAKEGGVRWAYLLTGSFNNSNNFHSAEIQILARLPADSPLAAAVRDSIVKTAQAERDSALWLDQALLRHTLARLIGHSPLELAVDGVRAIAQALKGDVGVVQRELEKALAAGTTLVQDTIVPAAAKANIERLMALLGWYAGEKKPPLNLQRAVAAAAVLAYPDLSAYEKKVLLNSFLWEDIPDAELERQTGEAWRVLGIKEAMPERKEKPGS